jgi:hypothetical protein
VREVYIYNESVSHDAYKAFDGLVRTSELREVAGTITLSMDASTLEIVAAFTHPSSTSTKAIAQAGTVENLFEQVLSVLAPQTPSA